MKRHQIHMKVTHYYFVALDAEHLTSALKIKCHAMHQAPLEAPLSHQVFALMFAIELVVLV